MLRLAYAAAASVIFVGAYSLSPLVAVAIAAAAAAVITAAIALTLHNAERAEIDHVMDIIEACATVEPQMPMQARLVS